MPCCAALDGLKFWQIEETGRVDVWGERGQLRPIQHASWLCCCKRPGMMEGADKCLFPCFLDPLNRGGFLWGGGFKLDWNGWGEDELNVCCVEGNHKELWQVFFLLFTGKSIIWCSFLVIMTVLFSDMVVSINSTASRMETTELPMWKWGMCGGLTSCLLLVGSSM